MIVRLATMADAVRILDVVNSNLDDVFSLDAIEFFLAEWPNGQLIAEDLFGNIVGILCSFRINQSVCSISLFAVDKNHRNQGVGTQLFQSFHTRCYMEGISRIQLELRTSNVKALRFYQRNGFWVAERMENFYSNGGSAYRMAKDIRRRSFFSYDTGRTGS